MAPTLICNDEQRRRAVRRTNLNGLDYVELQDERELRAFFLGKAPEGLTKEHFRVRGGRSITDLRVVAIDLHRSDADDEDDTLDLFLDRRGDLSPYELCVVELDDDGRATGNLHPGFDPRYACAPFTFAVDCPSDLDCRPDDTCPPAPQPAPAINYLAKDYASFRQLILDRLALTMPDWTERHVPDLGITLVELLAYVGDHLSYHQDAVAVEAYLDTARRRISVRRHARLVDYHVHDGANARAFLHLAVGSDGPLPEGLSFLAPGDDPPGSPPLEPGRVYSWREVRRRWLKGGYEVFQPLTTPGATPCLRVAHNAIRLYTWGDADCCLPRGATRATLVDGEPPPPAEPPGQTPGGPSSGEKPDDHKPYGATQTAVKPVVVSPPPAADACPEPGQGRALALRAGDLLLFEEVLGPRTGLPADADPTRRHVVRLTKVVESVDPLNGQPLLEVAWAIADALPFPLCLSVVGPPPECQWLTDVTLARGNVLLVDHGRWVDDGPWCVPEAGSILTCESPGQLSEITRRAGRFRPRLESGPLVFAEPYPTGPAAAMLRQDPRRAVPALRLNSAFDPACLPEAPPPPEAADEPCEDVVPSRGQKKRQPRTYPLPEQPPPPPPLEWQPQRDLFTSGPLDLHVVAEVDDHGLAHLRFGDGRLGYAPRAGHSFCARYRVGGGLAGNVGAETITVVVGENVQVGGGFMPRNPLAASGGQSPEPLADVRRFAPFAFRHRLERAVTAEDYAALVRRDFADEVQNAAAALRWSGSWYEALVAVDARGGPPSADLLARVTAHLERYRRMGHDLRVAPAHHVPLRVAMTVCVRPGFLAGHVKAALLGALGAGTVAGVPGFFHPDRLTFGQGIALSALVAVAQNTAGVDSVRMTALQRQFAPPAGELDSGFLPLGPLEIAQLDNDPSRPDQGILELTMEGGR